MASNLPGQRLVRAASCTLYDIQAKDTCRSISQAHDVSYAQIISWNPELDSSCSKLANLTSLCITNPSGGGFAMPSNDRGVTTTVATTTSPVPSPTAPDSNARGGEWHFVEKDESCSTITEKYHIGLKDFVNTFYTLFLNPQLWTNCTNLWADTYYCSEAVGSITTYPGYLPTTTDIPFVPVEATSLPWVPDVLENYTSTEPIIPIANGTRKDCYDYMWLDNITDTLIADCWAMAMVFDTTGEEFILWNPSLENEDTTVSTTVTVVAGVTSTLTNNPYAYPCTLSESISYCVQLSSPTPRKYVISPNVTIPTPRAAGETPDCTQWDLAESYSTCDDFVEMFWLTNAEFYEMNPSTGEDCDGLVPGTYYCVSTLPGGAIEPDDPLEETTSQSGTVTSTSKTVTSTATSGHISTPSPIQTGMVKNCNLFYKVVADDGCYDIAQAQHIALDDLYAWNPAVGTSCEGLQANVYICVGVAATATTTTTATKTTGTGSGTVVTPTPTQTGIVDDCRSFYLVVADDTCYDIAQQHGILLDSFYAWNPAVKTDCSGLQAKVYVCIGL
ncbi:uncharacterized protein C8A04DRAFT_14700 [Dichotomopilus funicola]|uniref:LysM domain-containing protein n=1 Tax=Dichotomopilus funicola TaxID=1934379 RepID=A0AAN6ZKG7_9PEZI|nr:hypothetical protein C8A04DRAFT_14700 [Dichotomopilus funicola]